MTNKQVVYRLRHPNREVPLQEFEVVIHRREEFVPLLIEEIKRVTQLGAKADLDDDLATFALYLLAQLREPRALEPIMKYFAPDETTPQDLFGDVITEDGGRILAAVGHGNPEALEAYVRREGLSVWVQSAALQALALQAVWNIRPREQVVRFFVELMRSDAFGDDADRWTSVVGACKILHPGDMLADIERLYARGLIDPFIIGKLQTRRDEAAEDPETYRELMREYYPLITNAADAVSWWPIFRQPEPPEIRKPRGVAVRGTPILAPSAPTVGRNDLCPCGSGKKHKKCCMPQG
ncbi:DUF1186 domain-containing protein [Verrucomicrobiota bacterium sgz303538]